MAMTNLVQLRDLATLLYRSPLPVDLAAQLLRITVAELELALERLAGLGWERINTGELVSLVWSPLDLLLPRLKAIECMAVHREVVTFVVEGEPRNLASAVLYLASQSADALYKLHLTGEAPPTMQVGLAVRPA